MQLIGKRSRGIWAEDISSRKQKDERKTKTKGELLKRKNFVTAIHLTTNTNKYNLRENLNSSKRSSPVSRKLPTHILFFLFNQKRQSPIGEKFASAKTKKQDRKKKRK